MRILITGGAGFAGHHFVEHFLKTTDADLLVLDKLTYASTWDRLRDIGAWDEQRVRCFSADFSQPISDGVKRELGPVDYIFHLGAETHVDNSIVAPERFVQANVVGTLNMLELARELRPTMFYYFSSDEVFGPAPRAIAHKECDEHNPTNPYAATKSGGEMLCRAYRNSYGVPIVITRTMNLFGERQHPEKFIPLVIKSVLSGQEITIHADASCQFSGSRFYLHARNAASAYQFLLDHAFSGQCYHIVGEREVSNLELAEIIARLLSKPLFYRLVAFTESRPGHDLRYALDGSKLAALGWSHPVKFTESLERTVQWYLEHPTWL